MAQVKHVRRLSLARLEALGLEMQAVGSERGKIGLVVVKRRAVDEPIYSVYSQATWM
ncbi:MAG: hypothetical protein L0191_11070 [Acidobacteria bacterium]|nr:hypothetical protein [Acidobacteriota bacterium]